MWFSFLLAWGVTLLILYVPGYFILRACGRARLRSFLCAPPITIVVIEALCILYDKLEVAANPLTVVLPVVLVGGTGYFLSRLVLREKGCHLGDAPALPCYRGWFKRFLHSDLACALLYIGVSTIISGVIFVTNLDGPASFPQDSDNSAHLSWIKSFADSQVLSTLNVGFYHDLEGGELTLVNTAGGYYPAGWHMVCALVAQACGVSAPLAANAVNYAFLSVLIPTGLFLFLGKLFEGKRAIVYCGAFVCLAFPSFPWGLILPPQGPLYPNFASFSLLPYAFWGFMEMVSRWRATKVRAGLVAYFVLASAAIGIMHPNGIFSLYAGLAIYVIVNATRWAYGVVRRKKQCRMWQAVGLSIGIGLLLTAVSAFFWYVFMQIPSISRIVAFSWPSYLDLPEALCRVLGLSFGRPNLQVILPLVTVIGVGYTFIERRYLWITIAFGFFCVSFIAAAATDGPLDSALTGFWYTDGNRVAGNAGFFGIPLAAMGLSVLVRFARNVAKRSKSDSKANVLGGVAALCVIVIFIVLNFSRCVGDVWTAFDDAENCFAAANNAERPNTYSPEEREFVKRVKDVVEPNDLILNVADDGSSFAYASDGLNLVYRRSSDSWDPGDDDGLLRKKLNELGTSPEVREVLETNGVKYILLLDQGGDIREERCYYGYYKPENWAGYNAIDDTTPGLETVLAEGDMRLYKIIDEIG